MFFSNKMTYTISEVEKQKLVELFQRKESTIQSQSNEIELLKQKLESTEAELLKYKNKDDLLYHYETSHKTLTAENKQLREENQSLQKTLIQKEAHLELVYNKFTKLVNDTDAYLLATKEFELKADDFINSLDIRG